MPVTIKELAEELGVGRSTVSYVLSGKADSVGISSQTAQRIMAKARLRGCKPNRIARALQAQKSQTVGVVFPGLESSWAHELTQGLCEGLDPSGYRPLIGVTFWDNERERREIEVLLANQVEALAVTPDIHSEAIYREVLADGVPLYFVGDRLTALPEVTSIMLDGYRTGQHQVQHLLELGHRRIAYVGVQWQSVQIASRLDGYRDAIHQAGLLMPDSYVRMTQIDHPDTARNQVQDLMRLPDPPTAIAVVSDAIAYHVLDQLRRQGIDVPDQVSVIGVGDLKESSWASIELTTIAEPRAEMGRQLAARISRVVAGEAKADESSSQEQNVSLTGDLVTRNTTAVAPVD